METKQKTKDQLKNDLKQKINAIKVLLDQAFKYELESDERIEFSNIIASSLRAILCGDEKNKNTSLIRRAGYDEKLFFPIYNANECINCFPSYNLLQFSINGEGVKVQLSDNLFKTGGFWGMYLTYESWLNEVVIDTKKQGIEPLSRKLIIKSIADSSGAHVDNNFEEHLFEMSKHDVLPIVIIDGVEVERDLEAKAKSIFCETILGIAKELVDAFEIWPNQSLKILGPSRFDIRVQKYACSNPRFELVKFGVHDRRLPVTTYTYNANRYCECDVYSKRGSLYQTNRMGRTFQMVVIDYRAILDGDYLGKSIYPQSSDDAGGI